MTCHPPDYLSMPSGNGHPASSSLSNPLLRPLDGNDLGVALLCFQEASSFLRGTHNSKMVGQVLGMCPAKEIKHKLEMNTASDLERYCSSRVNPRLALKSFQRSDASKVFKPEETRPAVWCRRTIYNILCYFVDADIVRKSYIMEKRFSYLDVYNFLRDRLRSIWQDLTVQHCTKHRAYIECFEISIRFLIYSNEVLCENEEYDIAQNSGLLNTCLDKLMQGYEDVHKYHSASRRKPNMKRNQHANLHFDEIMDVLVYKSPHEAEFWSYRLLLHIPQLLLPGGSATFCDIRQRMPEDVKTNRLVTFAIEVCHAAASGNLYRYFQLMRHADCTALHAALMNRFAICLRVLFLQTLVVRKIAKSGVNPLSMDTFKSIFGFLDEPNQNVEKFLTKYDVTLSQDESKVFLRLDEANGDQLTYDSASLQKLANKFQTTSNIVKKKFDAYGSRQKFFDPDFEYPNGTGPDTQGPPLSEDMQAAISVSLDMQQSTKGLSSNATQFNQGPMFAASSCNDLRMGTAEAPPLTFGSSSSSFPAIFDLPTKNATPFLFGASSQQADNVLAGGTSTAEREPRAFGATNTQTTSSLFSFDNSYTGFKVDNKSFTSSSAGTSTNVGGSSSIFGVSTAASDTSTHISGNPQSNASAAPILFTFGASSSHQIDRSNTSSITASDDVKDKNPFAFLQSNPATKEAEQSASSSADDAVKSQIASNFASNKDTGNVFSFGVSSLSDKGNSGTPLFKFGNVDSSVQSNVSPAADNAEKTLSVNVVSTGGLQKIFGISSHDPNDKGLHVAPLFAAAGASVSSKEIPLSTALASISDVGPSAHATTSDPTQTVSVVTRHAIENDSGIKKIHSLGSIIDNYERARKLRHVRVKKPKISSKSNAVEVGFPLSKEMSRQLLRNLRKIGSIILTQAPKSKDSFMLQKLRKTVKEHCPLFTNCDIYCRIDGGCHKSKKDLVCGDGSSRVLLNAPNIEVNRNNVTGMVMKNANAEITPRQAHKADDENIIYLNRCGSTKYLFDMYIKHIEKGPGYIIHPYISCDRCVQSAGEKVYSQQYGYRGSHFKDRLSVMASSIARYTGDITAAIAGFVRRRLSDASAEGDNNTVLSSGSTNTDKDGHSTVTDIAYYTASAMKSLARTTADGAIATGRCMAEFYRTSKRLINGVNDIYRISLGSDVSPLYPIVKAAVDSVELIMQNSEARMKGICSMKLPIDGYDIWSTGIFWHIKFFDSLKERNDLIQVTSTNEGRLRLTSALVRDSINDYMNSDYCLRLKEDVLHMAGFDINAEHLIPDKDFRRYMLEYYKDAVSIKRSFPDSNMQSVPMTLAVSLCFCGNKFSDTPEIRLRPGVNHVNFNDVGGENKKRKLFDGSQLKNALLTESSVWPMDRMIAQSDMRYNNKGSIIFYAFSQPIFIGEADVLHRILGSVDECICHKLGSTVSSIDNYGIISSVVDETTIESERQYTTCIVCYRMALSQLDLLTIYEFMNPSLHNTISLCGCIEKGREIRKARLTQIIDAVENSLLNDVIAYASQLNLQLDPNELRKHIVFACVGFQLHVDHMMKSVSDIPKLHTKESRGNHFIRVPRILYEDGLWQALQSAATLVVESHNVHLLQRPFQIPNLHEFLMILGHMSLDSIIEGELGTCRALEKSLQLTIDDVERKFTEDHWDLYFNSTMHHTVETALSQFSDVSFDYSKKSFISLLRALQSATALLSSLDGRAALTSETDTLAHRIHSYVSMVLSKVVVRDYKVPYAVGLYMSNIGGKERE
ncbi:SAC3/GANP family protein [Babesia divergens]|uniref:SAC3/GANP family protein n=1 Tax=Babesia divergens TaxID=32595 RepID=A0AAD9G6C1_BABDI|nr:SAC3/GANP family protein [Babesia divergens]